MNNIKKFYYREWKNAERECNEIYANQCKNKYREAIMKSLEQPFRFYSEKLKQYPDIYLN